MASLKGIKRCRLVALQTEFIMLRILGSRGGENFKLQLYVEYGMANMKSQEQ
jgi:hypothetical protein